MVTISTDYPMSLSIDYPDRKLNKLTIFFRLLMVIPIAIIFALLTYSSNYVILPTILLILFLKKYPRWWFDWNLALTRFSTRISAYIFLLRDEYPSTDEEQAVHVDIPYPNVKEELNRWLPLVKWILAIPHYVVLYFLFIGVMIVVVIAWFAILFTGHYPKSLFDYIVGVLRWSLRVYAYAFLLTTDHYPPFRLSD